MTSSEIPFQSVLIYGMGMMGSSLSLALKDSEYFHGRVDGIVRSEKSWKFIKEHGICDKVFRLDSPSAFQEFPVDGYDLIVLGLPVGMIIQLAEFFPEYGGIVTDMSSTRRRVASAFSRRSDIRFTGSHPMCGSEDAGPSAAKHDLFHNRLCIILPPEKQRSGQGEDMKKVSSLWEGIGMKTFRMSEKDHDEVLAYLSHGPHVLAGLIALWARNGHIVNDMNSSSPLPISGGGFRDMVRIAGSNKKMWVDILETNREFILESLREYKKDLGNIIEHIENFDREFFMEWFADARKARNILCGLDEDNS